MADERVICRWILSLCTYGKGNKTVLVETCIPARGSIRTTKRRLVHELLLSLFLRLITSQEGRQALCLGGLGGLAYPSAGSYGSSSQQVFGVFGKATTSQKSYEAGPEGAFFLYEVFQVMRKERYCDCAARLCVSLCGDLEWDEMFTNFFCF